MNKAIHARFALPYPALFASLLGFCVQSAAALSLGEMEVRSYLGQPLDLRITLDNAAGEYVDMACFSLLLRRSASQNSLSPASARFALDERLTSKVLLVRSVEAINDTSARIQIRAACEGQAPTHRDYTFQLDSIASVPTNKTNSIAPVAPSSVAATFESSRTKKMADPTKTSALKTVKADTPSSGKPVADRLAKTENGVANAAANSMSERTPRSEVGEFRLKLSTAHLDLSRSRGVSEDMRRNLREKQLAYFADDQGAALQALKNTITQLEARLSEMQLSLSQRAQAAAPTPAAPAPTVAPPRVAPSEVAPVTEQPPATVIAAPDSTPTTQPAAALARQPDNKPTALEIAPPAAQDAWWTKSWVWLLAGFTLLLIGVLLRLMLRANEPGELEVAEGNVSNPFTDWANAPDADLTTEPEPGAAQPGPPRDTRRAPSSETPSSAEYPLNSPYEEIPALLDLDTRQESQTQFARAKNRAEDHERRLRYMEERYAEIANASISVNDADSIIDAARLYYEEGQVQKAIELLTYALEERPAQLRFWLALIEIYRLERMTPEFCILAAKFRDLHSGADVWAKVQHIGRDLDPSNPLFAAALGRLGLPDEREFDPMSENWLNAPMDLTSDVLMVELRSSLLDEHGVEPADLSGTSMSAA